MYRKQRRSGIEGPAYRRALWHRTHRGVRSRLGRQFRERGQLRFNGLSAERNRAGTVLSIPAVAMIQVVHNRKIAANLSLLQIPLWWKLEADSTPRRRIMASKV